MHKRCSSSNLLLRLDEKLNIFHHCCVTISIRDGPGCGSGDCSRDISIRDGPGCGSMRCSGNRLIRDGPGCGSIPEASCCRSGRRCLASSGRKKISETCSKFRIIWRSSRTLPSPTS
ncbi:hypothetical protein QE152_g22058 [Popillia japonica]|uniref:Uncharacterized protein n=1 Tax=Popillia japonica TaxID=7064 RepID=A0AAW1KN94_POPJA